MKNIVLILIVMIGISGCATAPPYSGPTLPLTGATVSGIRHRVKAGQTLWRISRIYNVEIDDILRFNHISEDAKIEIGQILLIPNQPSIRNEQVIKTSEDDFIWPVKGRVISGFGSNYRNLMNKGINIQAPFGSDILAIRSGRVVFYSANFGNFGKTIIIDHGGNLRSIYSRIAEAFVKPGSSIQKGELIGRVGSSLRDKDSYLHFEIRKGALPQNPLFYLS